MRSAARSTITTRRRFARFVRAAAAGRPPLVVNDSGDVIKSTPFQIAARIEIMIMFQEGHFPAHRASRHRRDRVASAARCDDSGADGSAEDTGQTGPPPRLSCTTRTASSTRTGCPPASAPDFEFSRVLSPLAPFRDRTVDRHRPGGQSGRSARRWRRRSLTRLGLVPDGRAREEVRHHRAELGVDGSDRRARLRARDAAVVAAA